MNTLKIDPNISYD